MKNLLPGLVFVFASLAASAQNDTIYYATPTGKIDTITFTPTLKAAVKHKNKAVYGIHAGVNKSWFVGAEETYNGFSNANTGFIGGLFSKIPLSTRWFMQPELNYLTLGARNPAEDNIKFSTYHIQVPVSIGYSYKEFSIMVGAYAGYLVKAGNHTWHSGGYYWETKKWDYYHQLTYGATWGASYNLYGMYLELHGIVGLRKVQRVDYGDKKLGRDAAISLGLYLPFETFK